MTLGDTAITAVNALRLHKLRSALTMLGIVIGVAAVIAMVAVGGGARQQVVERIRSLGANLLVVRQGNITRGGVRTGADATVTLTDLDAAAIMKEVPTVQVTSPYVAGRTQVVAGGANWSTIIYGVDLGWFEAREWPIEFGRLFEPDEVSRGAQVALIGQTVSYSLFAGLDPIGQEIRVKNVPFRIIGVMAKKGETGWGRDQDDVVFLPLPAARQRVLGRNLANARAVGGIFVKVREGESLANTETEVKSLLRQRHRLQPNQEDDFSIRNLADILATREESARTLALLLAAVAGVSLAVGGIGIMNIMLVSVTERTREIGLRLAVGARQRDILRQFLFEATGLAAIGGAVGVAVGVASAYVISNAAGWPLLIEPQSIVLAVVFSGVVGVFFGWYPALRASRLDPIEALRHT
jgi:putative ABC transport system permease protein